MGLTNEHMYVKKIPKFWAQIQLQTKLTAHTTEPNLCPKCRN